MYRIATILWVLGCLFGFIVFERYERTPGATSDSRAESLPENRPSPRELTALLFVHPHCPCAFASVAELERLVARYGDRLSAKVVFVRPRDAEVGWEQGKLWLRVTSTSDLQAVVDESGGETRRFGAKTSGQVYLMTQDGRIVFEGGLTASRSQTGISRNSIDVWMEGTPHPPSTAPVYGCPLE